MRERSRVLPAEPQEEPMNTTRARGNHGSPAAYVVVSFAAAMLLVVAVMQVLEGIAAVAKDDVFATGIDYAYQFDITTWGWINIVLGVLGLATALGILSGQVWGHLAGVGIAGLSALFSFAFLPYYPIWALVVIAINTLIIWALCNQIASDSLR
jgi:hypothetical protein